MTPRFVFRPAAIDDLREARDWYDAQRAGLGAEVGQTVEEPWLGSRRVPMRFPRSRPEFAAP